jgi:hypothetical protein
VIAKKSDPIAAHTRKDLMRIGPGDWTPRAKRRPIAGIAGRMYPGSFDLEIEKKRSENSDQARRNDVKG